MQARPARLACSRSVERGSISGMLYMLSDVRGTNLVVDGPALVADAGDLDGAPV